MTVEQYKIFSDFRSEFRSYCADLALKFGGILRPLQKSAGEKDTPEYKIENPVVYNTALDEISEKSEIKLIVIGDNPGKDEQLDKNQKYLVGQSGKIAAGFFKNHCEFGVDFRKNAIILNKTPLHTAKTKHLKILASLGGEKIRNLIDESQIWMAKKTAELHIGLCRQKSPETFRCAGKIETLEDDFAGLVKPELFLVGYSELKKNGIFSLYRDELKKNYGNGSFDEWKSVFVFQHFSMNRFSIDLKNFMSENAGLGIVAAARELGEIHKNEIF